MINKNIVCLDCFDTIISRKCFPEFIKMKWAEEVGLLMGLDVSSKQIYDIRTNMERILREENHKNGFDYEFRIKDLYKKVLEAFYLSNLTSELNYNFINKMHEIEIKLELENQYVSNRSLELLQEFKNQNKRIFIISDFYMGSDDINLFLKNLKIEKYFEKVFVSSDYLKTKITGNLYKVALNALKIGLKDCVMIGDNKYSDVKIPRSLGLSTKQFDASCSIKKYNKQNKVLNKKKLFKFFKNIFYNNKSYNFENYAFQLYLFSWSLARECEKRKIKKLFFLSREGHFLKQLFDKYCVLNNVQVDTQYLQVSRNSTFIPSLKDIADEKFSRLFRETEDMSIRDFLISLSFSLDEIALIAKDYNGDIETKINKLQESEQFKMLKTNKQFQYIYDNKRCEQKRIFKKYLKELGYNESETLYIVDVGWKGTMQDNLMSVFDGQIKIEGFYLGLTNTGSIDQGSHKYGLLFDLIRANSRKGNKIYSYWYLNYEQILRANHKRVQAYIDVGSKVEIEYDNLDDTNYYKEYLKNFHDFIMQKFVKIDNNVKEMPILFEDFNNMCIYSFVKMMKKMTLKDYKLIRYGENQFADSFGRVYTGGGLKMSIKNYIIEKLRAEKVGLLYLMKRD